MSARPVLVSEGGGATRAALSTVRLLAAAGYAPSVATATDMSLAAASRHCARVVRVPSARTDPAGYAEAVRSEQQSLPYVDVLPASDVDLVALGRALDLLDKEKSAAAAAAAGFEVPQTQVFESRASLLAAADTLPYPVVVKPAVRRFTAQRADNPSQLAAIPGDDARLLVQPFITEQLSGVLGVAWHGEILLAAHLRYLRVWPSPCGTASAAETVAPDDALEQRLARLFADYDGMFHVDLAGPHLLDINPRMHPASPVVAAAGINLPARWCDLMQGIPVARARARAGAHFRWEEGDARSVVRGVRQHGLPLREAVHQLRPRRGTAHSIVSLTDPAPAAVRARALAQRVRNGRAIEW